MQTEEVWGGEGLDIAGTRSTYDGRGCIRTYAIDALVAKAKLLAHHELVHDPSPERGVPVIPLIPPARYRVAAVPARPLPGPVEQIGAQPLSARIGRAPWRRLLIVRRVVELQEPATVLRVLELFPDLSEAPNWSQYRITFQAPNRHTQPAPDQHGHEVEHGTRRARGRVELENGRETVQNDVEVCRNGPK